MRLKIFASILFALVCIFPGSQAGFFNGLPLSWAEICFSFFIFLTIFSTSWEKTKIIRKAVFASLALFLVFQFSAYKFLPFGWSACLYSNTLKGALKLQSKCEPTTKYPAGESSYLFKDINFDSENMPLYFLNMTRFNFYEKGEPKRNSLPFILEAQTYVYPQENEKLTVQSEKKVLVRINEKEFIYSNLNKPSAFDLVTKEINNISLKYSSSRNKKNQLKASLESPNFYKNNFSSSSPFFASIYKIVNNLLLLVLFFCFIYSFLSCFLKNEKKHRFAIGSLGLMLLLFLAFALFTDVKFKIFFIPSSIIFFLSSAYYLFLKSDNRKKILPFLLLIFFLNSVILTTAHLKPEEAILFQGGGDELGHESFARSSFSVTSFQGFLHSTENKSAYYYQPLHRYFLAFFHKVLGEPMWGPYLAQTFLFSLAFILCALAIDASFGLAAALSFSFIYFILLSYKVTSVFFLSHTPYQQSIAFPFALLGIACLLFLLKKQKIDWRQYFLFGLIWSAVFMMRTDWIPILPGIFIFLIYKFYRPKLKILSKIALASFLVGLAIFPFLIGLRNLLVAEKFVIMPTSGFVNLLPEIKTALGEKITYHEHSSVKFAYEISSSFFGRYRELAAILWKNIYDNIIKTSAVRQVLWLLAGVLSLLNIYYRLRKRRPKHSAALICLLASFVSLIAISSFFGQHNGLAMFVIYDLFIVILLAINLSMFLHKSNKALSDFLKSKIPEKLSFTDKIKIYYRPYICPFGDLLSILPEKSAVFDIGCGNGMFLSLASGFKNPKAIGGIEVSKHLIDTARVILGNPPFPVFLDIFDGKKIPGEIYNYNYVFLIDVLHHVQKKYQLDFLKSIYDKMSPNSSLILKDIDASRKVLSKFNKLHDLILSGEIGHELRSEEAAENLTRIGFKIISIKKKRVLLYPHYTIVCKK